MLCSVALQTQMVEQRINSEVQIKVLIEPMNNPLGVSPSKGNQGTTWGKEDNLLTSVGIEPTTSGLDLLLLCYQVGQRKSDDLGDGSIPTEVKRLFSLPCVVPWLLLLRQTPSGLFMGSISILIYTSELILCSTICVHSVDYE